ncbi:MAG TPA: CoA ester lyase, partial [Nocardioidaceae bacterium]|nr:CoA ester lyase [Nocardioidaceae bacterium]
MLCVPGSSERMLHKAFSSPVSDTVDQVVIDLEDAVAPADKSSARALAVSFLRSHSAAVRVNGVGTPWVDDDLAAVGSLATSIVLPKVEAAADVEYVGAPVQALIESAYGLLNLEDICHARGLVGLIIGYADLGASLHRRSPAPSQWVPAQERVLWAARARGIAAIDGPHLGVHVDSVFEAAVQHAAAAGFDGKWVIHPAQLDTVNDAFSATADEIEWAQRVLTALGDAGAGAVQ